MPNAWDIGSSPHVKIGDEHAEKLFTEVGRALSKWEGLEAANGVLFAVLTSGPFAWQHQPALRAFGTVTGTMPRSDMILKASEALFENFNAHGADVSVTTEFQLQIKLAMKNYMGWASRRNDIAHGCVTENQTNDYREDDAPLKTFYLLCPSHTNSRKWHLTAEPVYQYRADEILGFGNAFEELETVTNSLADSVGFWFQANIQILQEQ